MVAGEGRIDVAQYAKSMATGSKGALDYANMSNWDDTHAIYGGFGTLSQPHSMKTTAGHVYYMILSELEDLYYWYSLVFFSGQ